MDEKVRRESFGFRLDPGVGVWLRVAAAMEREKLGVMVERALVFYLRHLEGERGAAYPRPDAKGGEGDELFNKPNPPSLEEREGGSK